MKPSTSATAMSPHILTAPMPGSRRIAMLAAIPKKRESRHELASSSFGNIRPSGVAPSNVFRRDGRGSARLAGPRFRALDCARELGPLRCTTSFLPLACGLDDCRRVCAVRTSGPRPVDVPGSSFARRGARARVQVRDASRRMRVSRVSAPRGKAASRRAREPSRRREGSVRRRSAQHGLGRVDERRAGAPARDVGLSPGRPARPFATDLRPLASQRSATDAPSSSGVAARQSFRT